MVMKIGVDCRPLTRSVSGIRKYTYELLKRLTLQEDAHWYLYSYNSILEEIDAKKNISLECCPDNSKFGELIWYHTQLPKYLTRDGIDIFWSPRHHLPYFLNRKIKSVVSIHDLTWIHQAETMKLQNYWAEKLQIPYSIKRADKIITISNYSRSAIQDHFHHSKKKIEIISCAASLANNLQKVNALPPKYLLFVGTIEPRKNIFRLLSAYKNLTPQIKKDYPLVIVGGNGWKVSLTDLIEELNLFGNVLVFNNINDAELAYIYSKAKLLLMPSLYEGFGLPILEAFQYGIPAIASNTSSMPEVLGDAGLTVNPYEIGGISTAINKLLTSTKEYKKYQENINDQLKKYDWQESSDKLWGLFKELKI